MTVTKWERAGLPIARRGRRGKPSRYREVAVRAWLQQREEAAQSVETGVDLAHARARKELAQAIEAEQRVALRAKVLIPIEEVDRIWSGQIAAVRARLLAWPAALADRLHRVAATEGAPGIERLLQEAVYDTLRELAETPVKPVLKPRRAKVSRRKAAA